MSAGAAVRMYSVAAAAALRATPAAALRAAPAAALRAAPAASALRASHPPHVGLEKEELGLGTAEATLASPLPRTAVGAEGHLKRCR